nr:uncharacterized protein K02A2.6-like [Lytechinus pictus]
MSDSELNSPQRGTGEESNVSVTSEGPDSHTRSRGRPGGTRTNVPLPRPLSFTGDMKKNWAVFSQMWESYEIITGLDHEDDKFRIAHFITAIGPEALEVQQGLPFQNDGERKSFKQIWKLWSEYCLGKTNVTFERYHFNKSSQNTDETVENYYVRLRSLASSCEFGTLTDELIRDRIVLGIRDDNTRKRLLQEPSLTLSGCLDICRAFESSKAQSKAMQEPVAAYVVSQKPKYVKHSGGKSKKSTPKLINCGFCGKQHEKNKLKCPAYGQKCKLCKKENHFAVKCRQNKNKAHKVEVIEESEDSEEECVCVSLVGKDEAYQISSDRKMQSYQRKIIAKFRINDKEIGMQVDCGATCNVIHEKDVPSGTELSNTNQVLSVYSEGTVPVAGKCKLHLRNVKNNKKYLVPFVVVKGTVTRPLLGASTAQQMKLITVQYGNIEVVHAVTNDDILTSYKDVFTGLGKMPGTVHLQTDSSVEPVIMPPRRVPIVVKDKLKQELERLEKLNVVAKVTEPTEWVSGLVVVQKPSGKIRVCIDPQYLNRSLKRGHYPLPVIEDVLPMMNKAKVFTKADCKEGFLQCELDQESSYLTTFQTPWGRFRWQRMPFGISPAPEIFQCHLDQNLEGLPGMYKIADDILIVGRGDSLDEANEDHDRNLRMFLDRCRERGIKLNPDKLEYKKAEVRFMGHIISRDGLKVDPQKVAAIADMPVPDSVESLQRFIGMVKYLSKYLPALSDISEPLRRLTHKDCVWTWNEQQQEAFDMIKQKVCEAPVLRYFDASAPTEGQGDASQFGLGFALLQHGQPVAYASRALTPAETRYSQIEKELLAQVFGLEKHHEYVYGRKIILWTDHKPLVAITQKPLATAPKRLQRLLLRLQQYDVCIQYMPGPQLHLADTLSRAYIDNTTRSQTGVEAECIHLIDGLRISEPTRIAIKQATADDASLQTVIKYVCQGWPALARDCANNVRQYFSIKHELTVDDGIVFKGLRCVIPSAMRAEIRDKLHAAHTGIESTLKRARECVYWPLMTAELTDYIAKCPTCNEIPRSQQKESLHPHDIPNRPWEKIGCDIFEVDGNSYLCSVDYYSDYFEVDNLQGKKDACAIIKRLKRHFASHGIPDCIQSDNGPPFNSREFAEFAKQYGHKLTTSSPEYPQSNGKVESAVKIAKKLVKRSKRDHGDFYLSLLIWRNTPTASMNSSPAQRFLGRRTKNNIPIAAELLQPQVLTDVVERKQANVQRQAKYYNRNAKDLPQLQIGDIVRIRPRKKNTVWEKAKVVEQVDERSYLVETEDGVRRRRNRRHLRTSREEFQDKTDSMSYQSYPAFTNVPHDASKDTYVNASTEPHVNDNVSVNNTPQPANIVRRSVRNKRPPAYLKDYVRM